MNPASPGSSSTARVGSSYPILLLALAFALGIVVASVVSLSITASAAVCVAGAVLSIIFIRNRLTVVFVAVAFCAGGCLVSQLEAASVGGSRIRNIYDSGEIASGDPVEIEGRLVTLPEQGVNGSFLTVETYSINAGEEWRTASGTIRLFVPVNDESLSVLLQDDPDLSYGTQIRVACRLEREDRFLNPGVLPRREALDRAQIDATATVKSPMLIEIVDNSPPNSILSGIYTIRRTLIRDLSENLDPSSAGIMIASLLGDKHFIDRPAADAFREGGTFHILVISGLHITFIGGLLLLLIRAATRRRILHFLVPCVVLWCYTLAVGGEVPVVRASLMFTAVLFAELIGRPGTMINSLSLTSLLLLAWRPSDIFDPSFQLTIVSVAALVGCAFPLIGKLREIGKWQPSTEAPFPPNVRPFFRSFCETIYWQESAWLAAADQNVWHARIFKAPILARYHKYFPRAAAAFLFEGILVSAIVQLWMLPLLIVYFHRVSPAAIILNLWVGAFIALESFAAVVTVLSSYVNAETAAVFASVTELFNILMLSLPKYLSDGIFSSVRIPVYTGSMKAIYPVFLLPLFALAAILHRWNPFRLGRPRWRSMVPSIAAATATGCIALVIFFHPFSSPAPNGRLTIDFLDVGQGDSALVTFPNGDTMLIDGGGWINFDDPNGIRFEPDRPRIGEAVVSEFLWEKGYSRINYLVATHSDADHMQGIADVAGNFSVDAIFVGRSPAGDPEYEELQNKARRRGVPIRTLATGDAIELGGVRIEVLGPSRETPSPNSENDDSVVLMIEFRERRFLFTGDIEAKGESQLLNGPAALGADLIKVPHHGSKTSSTQRFVDAVKPRVAVISVGRHSIFGHPNPGVVTRWQNTGAEVLRTGERGTITISTDGNDLDLSVYKP